MRFTCASPADWFDHWHHTLVVSVAPSSGWGGMQQAKGGKGKVGFDCDYKPLPPVKVPNVALFSEHVGFDCDYKSPPPIVNICSCLRLRLLADL